VELYAGIHVDGKTELRFGETLAELCQGRNPDVVMTKVDGEDTRYSLSEGALVFMRQQELPSTHIIPRPKQLRITPSPKPIPKPVATPTPVITRDSQRGTKWKKVKTPKAVGGRMPWEPKTTMHVCIDCGADIVHAGLGRKPKRCPACREKHNPIRQCCPTCGRRLRAKTTPKETT
jgi:hypothetical protein